MYVFIIENKNIANRNLFKLLTKRKITKKNHTYLTLLFIEYIANIPGTRCFTRNICLFRACLEINKSILLFYILTQNGLDQVLFIDVKKKKKSFGYKT